MGAPDNIQRPAPQRVIVNPTGDYVNPNAGYERIYVPGSYRELDSPAAGPVYRSSGNAPVTSKAKSQITNATASTSRKIAEKILIPPLPKISRGEEAGAMPTFDAVPPTPTELGAPIVIPMIPRYDAVPNSKPLFLPNGNAPVPVDYQPPTADAAVQSGPTSLRAWNGEMTRETRTFDQTRVQVTTGADGARRWQFFWRTSGAKPRAARWEISAAPFVDDASSFPPPGLVSYGDASVNASAPETENFFSVEFNSLAKNFGGGSPPNQLYLRVVPVDASGNAAAQPSNWIRIDIR